MESKSAGVEISWGGMETGERRGTGGIGTADGDRVATVLREVGEEVEQQLAAGALEGHEAELVDDQQRDPQVTLMEPRERELVARLDQLAHEVGGADEGDAVAAACGLDAERDREVRLAGADRARR